MREVRTISRKDSGSADGYSKRESFDRFVRVLRLMEERKHLTVSGLIEIAEIVETMNRRKPSAFLRILRDHTPTISPVD